MSSRKAMYESSMLCGFAALPPPPDGFTNSGLTIEGADAAGPGAAAAAVTVETDGFAFAFGAAVSLLTRTDAGI